MTSDARVQRLIDKFHEGSTRHGGFSVRHGLAWVLRHLCATEADSESFYAIPQDRLESLAKALEAPSLKTQDQGRLEGLPAQRHPAPVPVSERLPKPEDCDGERNCWQWIPDISGHYPLGHWELQHRDWVSDPDGDATHWLPSAALPLPAGEVQP